METLLQGKKETITYSDGTTEEVIIKQIGVGEYEEAFKRFDSETRMAAFACGQEDSWINKVAPESYEMIVTTFGEVNDKGFFAYARRRSARDEQRLAQRMNSIKPEILASAAAKALPGFVPGLVPKPESAAPKS